MVSKPLHITPRRGIACFSRSVKGKPFDILSNCQKSAIQIASRFSFFIQGHVVLFLRSALSKKRTRNSETEFKFAFTAVLGARKSNTARCSSYTTLYKIKGDVATIYNTWKQTLDRSFQ